MNVTPESQPMRQCVSKSFRGFYIYSPVPDIPSMEAFLMNGDNLSRFTDAEKSACTSQLMQCRIPVERLCHNAGNRLAAIVKAINTGSFEHAVTAVAVSDTLTAEQVETVRTVPDLADSGPTAPINTLQTIRDAADSADGGALADGPHLSDVPSPSPLVGGGAPSLSGMLD